MSATYITLYDFAGGQGHGGKLPDEWRISAHLCYDDRIEGHEYLDQGTVYYKNLPAAFGGDDVKVDYLGHELK
jgi:hypothetical protein